MKWRFYKMDKRKIVLKMDGKYIKVPYSRLGIKQIIQFLEQEERHLSPSSNRKMEVLSAGVKP